MYMIPPGRCCTQPALLYGTSSTAWQHIVMMPVHPFAGIRALPTGLTGPDHFCQGLYEVKSGTPSKLHEHANSSEVIFKATSSAYMSPP